MDISLADLKIVIDVVRAFFILLALYFIGSRPFRKVKNRLQEFYEVSYILIAAPLIFPHQQHYAFLMVFPATTYLLYYLMMKYFIPYPGSDLSGSFRTRKIILITLMTIIYLVLNSHFILGQFNNLYDHFKVLTYGVLLLVGVLAFCRPHGIWDRGSVIRDRISHITDHRSRLVSSHAIQIRERHLQSFHV
jgi:hypothetical protein